MNIEEIKKEPLKRLDYFAEWGNPIWSEYIRYAVKNYVGAENFKDKSLLDVGTRYGKMSAFFALLGCRVTGADILTAPLAKARNEAEKFGVSNRINFVVYDGNPDIFDDDSFDFIFTKSVLVMLPDLNDFLIILKRKLKPGGRIISVENGRGSFVINLLRRFKHRSWDYKRAKYFDDERIAVFNNHFKVIEHKYNPIPPVHLFIGEKK